MLTLPISTPALVLHVSLQNSVTLTEGQKKIVEQVKAMGFTLKSQRHGTNNLGPYTRLEWVGRDGRIIEMNFYEASGRFGTASTVCQTKIILDLPPEKAKARGEDVKKNFPAYGVLVLPALEQPGKSEVHFTSYEQENRESDTVIPAHVQQLWEIAKACLEGRTLTPPKPAIPAPFIEKTLKATGLPYTDEDKSFKIIYPLLGNRSQAVYLRKNIQYIGTLKIQDVSSLFYESESPLSPEKLKSFLQKDFTLGGIFIEAPEKNKGRWRVWFKAGIPADCPPTALQEFIAVIAGAADDLEKELSPTNRL